MDNMSNEFSVHWDSKGNTISPIVMSQSTPIKGNSVTQ